MSNRERSRDARARVDMTSNADAPASARRRARPVPARRLPAALFAARLAARAAPHGARRIVDAPHAGSLLEIAVAKRTLLVTYRRDGTPVPTPVWAAERQGRLYVRSERSSGKVKRLRSDPHLLIAPCRVHGEPLGAPLEARATVLAAEQESFAEQALAARYGAGRALFEWAMDLMRVDMCYLEIEPRAWEPGPSSSSGGGGCAQGAPRGG